MNKILTSNEKKQYIMKTIPLSSGKRITEMLYRYWHGEVTKEKEENIVKVAKKVFNID